MRTAELLDTIRRELAGLESDLAEIADVGRKISAAIAKERRP